MRRAAHPRELSRHVFITGNLILDQAGGVGNGLGDLPAGVPGGGTGGTGDGGTGGAGGDGGGGPAAVSRPRDGCRPVPAERRASWSRTPPSTSAARSRSTARLPGNESLQMLFDGHQIGTIFSDAGQVRRLDPIPKGTAPGTHVLTVRGSDCVFNDDITVAGPGVHRIVEPHQHLRARRHRGRRRGLRARRRSRRRREA